MAKHRVLLVRRFYWNFAYIAPFRYKSLDGAVFQGG